MNKLGFAAVGERVAPGLRGADGVTAQHGGSSCTPQTGGVGSALARFVVL